MTELQRGIIKGALSDLPGVMLLANPSGPRISVMQETAKCVRWAHVSAATADEMGAAYAARCLREALNG